MTPKIENSDQSLIKHHGPTLPRSPSGTMGSFAVFALPAILLFASLGACGGAVDTGGLSPAVLEGLLADPGTRAFVNGRVSTAFDNAVDNLGADFLPYLAERRREGCPLSSQQRGHDITVTFMAHDFSTNGVLIMTRDEAAFFDELGELDLPSDQYVAVVNMNDVILGIEYAVDKCNGFASWDLGIFSSQVFMAVGLRFVNVGGQVQIIPGEPQLLIRNPAMLFPEGFLEGIASILDFFGIDANENDVRDYINRKAASYIQGPLAVRVLQLIRDELVDLL